MCICAYTYVLCVLMHIYNIIVHCVFIVSFQANVFSMLAIIITSKVYCMITIVYNNLLMLLYEHILNTECLVRIQTSCTV